MRRWLMRRMISDVMQRQIKNLFESASTDANGNVEISKNLTVDGNIKLNSPDNLTFKSGGLPKQYYYHFVRMIAYANESNPYSFKFSFLMPATSNLTVHNIDELITVFGGDYINCNGNMSYPGGDGQLFGLQVGTTASDTNILFSSGNGIEDTFALSNYGVIEIIDQVFQPK